MLPMMRDMSTLRKLMLLRGATGGGGGSPLTVSGPTPLLMPGALAKPMRKATFAIEAVQAGTGDPSPSNVRPITGHQSITAWVTGKNIFPYDLSYEGTGYGNAWYLSDHPELMSFFKALNAFRGQYIAYSATTEGEASGAAIGQLRVNNGASLLLVVNPNNYVKVSETADFTTADRIYVYGSTSGAKISHLMVTPGDTPLPYAPYTASTVSVSFPASVGTVYSGTIDPVTGQGVVTHRCVNFKDCINSLYRVTRNNADTGTVYRMYEPLDDYDPATGNIDALCDRLKLMKGANVYMEPNTFKVNNQAFWVCLPDDDIQDAEAWINANEPHVVYELATPIPFTLTPQSLIPPAGDAYIWADCGASAEVTYIGKATT